MRNDQLFGELKEVHHRSGPELVILLSENTAKMSFGQEMTCSSFFRKSIKSSKLYCQNQILIYFYLLLGTAAGLDVLITNIVYQVSSRHVHKFLSVLRLSQN